MIHDQYSVVGWDSRAREIVIGRRKNCDGEHKCATNLKIPAAQAPFGVQALACPLNAELPKRSRGKRATRRLNSLQPRSEYRLQPAQATRNPQNVFPKKAA